MKLNPTNKSNIFVDFFLRNNTIPHLENQRDIHPILLELYEHLLDAEKWLQEEKQKDPDFYHLTMLKIKKEEDIPLSSHLKSKYVEHQVVDHIKKQSVFLSDYTINVLGKQIKIHFVFEKNYLHPKWKEPDIQTMNTYVDNMLVWLYLANQFAEEHCADNLTIYIYLTSLEKKMPELIDTIIAPNHVNTGVTTSCPLNGEIAIYRLEEWFKVFIHESFHTLGLDFSDMDVDVAEAELKKLFHVDTRLLLYEAYTEFWARVINVVFVSFKWADSDSNVFLCNVDFLLDYERIHCVFQMNKLLTHMNLQYKDLVLAENSKEESRSSRYKEDTNAFVYYVITAILMNNYPKYIQWCNANHSKLLQFKLTHDHQMAFCEYIKEHHNTHELTNSIKCSSKLLSKLSISKKKTPKKEILLKSLAMSLTEFELIGERSSS
jgi:hypothetical protein